MVDQEIEEQQSPLETATWRERSITLVIAGIVLALDQYTKYLVESRLPMYEVYAPFPSIEGLFRFFHTTNTGAAFGILQDANAMLAVVASVVTVVVIYFNHILPADNRLLRVALGLQLGGIVGNLVDRIQLGHVTDFLDFGPWPVFNLADTALVSGVILLGYLMLFKPESVKMPGEEAAG